MTTNNFTSFRLEIGLKSPAIIQGPLTLESLLAASIYESTGLMREDALSCVPIESVNINNKIIWQASAVIFNGYVRNGRTTIIRRIRQTEIGPEFFEPNARARKTDPWALNQASGDYKALMNTYPTIQADSLVWYAIGEAEVCAQMVRDLMFIGKRRNQGFGEIEYVEVSKTTENPILDCSGMVRRPLNVNLLPYLKDAQPQEKQLLAYVPDKHPTWANSPILCAVPPIFCSKNEPENDGNEVFYD